MADFNGDGVPDLVIANSRIVVLFGDGSGGFHQPVATSYPGGVFDAVAAADFNGDGKIDLAVDDAASGSLLVFLGNGDGTFSGPLPAPGASSFALGDFNHHGIVDIAELTYISCPGSGFGSTAVLRAIADQVACQPVQPNGYVIGTLTILLGNGDGTFKIGPVMQTPADYNLQIVAADFDGDGETDLAWAEGNLSTIAVAFGNRDGTFQPPAEVQAFGRDLGDVSFQDMVTADFNGSGRQSLAVSTASPGAGIAVLLSNQDRTFTTTFVSPGALGPTVLTGDFNRDGIADLVSMRTTSVVTGSGPVYSFDLVAYLGHGDGTFTSANLQGVQAPDFLPQFAADLNGGGLPDVIGMKLGNAQSGAAFITQLMQIATTTSTVSLPEGPPGTHEVIADYEGAGDFESSRSTAIALCPSAHR